MKRRQQLPYFRLFTADYRDNLDFRALDRRAKGLLFDMLIEYWSRGSLPLDPPSLALALNANEDEIRELLPVLKPLARFNTKRGTISFPALDDEYRAALERRDHATKGALGRWSEPNKAETNRVKTVQESCGEIVPNKPNVNNAKEIDACPSICPSICPSNARAMLGSERIGTDQNGSGEELLKRTDPETDPTGAEIVTLEACSGPLAGAVREAVREASRSSQKSLPNTEPTEPENGNGLEREAQARFFELWRKGPYEWTSERDCFVAELRRYGRGPFNVAKALLEERRRDGGSFTKGEMAYFLDCAHRDFALRKPKQPEAAR